MTARDEAGLAEGRTALTNAGVGEDVDDPGVLVPLAGRSAALDRAIVERLGRRVSDAQARALQQLAAGADARGWKAAAKDARRTLYRFAQRGVTVAVAPAAPAPVRRAPPTLEGFLSPIDGRGDRLAWLIRPHPGGGVAVLTGIINEPAGLRDVTLAEMTRKAFRRMQQDLITRHGLVMAAADGAYCDALFAEAFERARAAGTPGVGEYPTYRARMLTTPPAPLEPPLIARVAGSEPPTSADTAAGAALLDEPEFATWPLARAALATHLDELAAARESPLVLSEMQQQERQRRVVAAALREVFAGAGGAAYRRRLEEMAFHLHATGRRPLARAAWASAAALAASTQGGEGIPFCEELLRRSVARHLAADTARQREEEAGSVLVRPGAAPDRPGPRRGR